MSNHEENSFDEKKANHLLSEMVSISKVYGNRAVTDWLDSLNEEDQQLLYQLDERLGAVAAQNVPDSPTIAAAKRFVSGAASSLYNTTANAVNAAREYVGKAASAVMPTPGSGQARAERVAATRNIRTSTSATPQTAAASAADRRNMTPGGTVAGQPQTTNISPTGSAGGGINPPQRGTSIRPTDDQRRAEKARQQSGSSGGVMGGDGYGVSPTAPKGGGISTLAGHGGGKQMPDSTQALRAVRNQQIQQQRQQQGQRPTRPVTARQPVRPTAQRPVTARQPVRPTSQRPARPMDRTSTGDIMNRSLGIREEQNKIEKPIKESFEQFLRNKFMRD